MNILEDQVNIPESKRKFPSPRNPHARSELYQDQEQLHRIEQLKDPNWYPTDTKYNIYNQKNAAQSTDVAQQDKSGH